MKTILMAFVALIVSVTIALCAAQIPGIINSTIDVLINSGELESAIKDQVDSEFDSKVDEATEYTLSGVWTFNETLPLFENGDGVEYDIAFTSNGKSYTCINFYNTPGTVVDVTMNYLVEKTGSVGLVFDNAYDSGWFNDDYRLVDFGSIPQFVSEEFYNWLIANAVQEVYVSGVWVFDDSAPENDGKAIEQSVNFSFESDEGVVTVNKMVISGHGELSYEPYSTESEIYAHDSNWCLSQTVDFGTTPQKVSLEFYQWLTAHAVNQ